MTIQIPSDQKLRVATLNLSNNTAFYLNRVQVALKEADKMNLDVLLLQEIDHTEKESIELFAKQIGYEHLYVSPSFTSRRQGEQKSSHTGILSRHPLTNANELTLTAMAGATKGAFATVEYNGHHIFVISVHLIKGADNGYIRLKQATLIEEFARRMATDKGKAIVGGTFNDVPDGDSVRYLKGLKASSDTKTAFWIDATEGSDIEHLATTRPKSLLGREVAEKNNVSFPELLPERKTDYLFSRGWVYGKVGMPLNPQLFGTTQTKEGLTLSDHYGVMAEFWFPKNDLM